MRKKKIQFFTIMVLLFLIFMQFGLTKMKSEGIQNNPVDLNLTTLIDDAYEDDDSFLTAQNITVNTAQERSIFPVADVDYAKFELDVFSSVTVETSGSFGDTRLWLFNYDKIMLDFDDDDGTNLFSKITRDYLSPGIYYLLIVEYGGDQEIENYTLTLTAAQRYDFYESDECFNPSLISYNSTQTKSIDPIGDYDYFTFTLASVYNVTLEIIEGDGDTIMGLCTDCMDYGATLIEENDDGGEGFLSKITRTNLGPSTYYVRVHDYNDNTEISYYTLQLTTNSSAVNDLQVPSISSVTHKPDTPVSSTSVPISASIQDMYGIMEAHVHYRINWGSWVSVEMYPSLFHYNATIGPFESGNVVEYYISASDNSINHNTAIQDNGGAYYEFTVNPVSDHDVYEKDNALSRASSILMNETQSRKIEPIGDIDYITFTTDDLYNVTIETAGVTGDTFVRLYHENHTELATDNNSGTDSFSKIEIELESGNYYMTVEESSNDETINVYDITLTVTKQEEIEPTPTPTPTPSPTPTNTSTSPVGIVISTSVIITSISLTISAIVLIRRKRKL